MNFQSNNNNNRHNKYLRSILLYILQTRYQNSSVAKKKWSKLIRWHSKFQCDIFIPLDIHKWHDDSIRERTGLKFRTDYTMVGICSLYSTLGCRIRGHFHTHVCIHLMGYPKTTNIKLAIFIPICNYISFEFQQTYNVSSYTRASRCWIDDFTICIAATWAWMACFLYK